MESKFIEGLNSTYHESVFKDLIPVVLVDRQSKLIIDANAQALAELKITLPYAIEPDLLDKIENFNKKDSLTCVVNEVSYEVSLHPAETIGSNTTYFRFLNVEKFKTIKDLETPYFTHNINAMLLIDSEGKLVAKNHKIDSDKYSNQQLEINKNLFDLIEGREHKSFDTVFSIIKESELMSLINVDFTKGDKKNSFDIIVNPFFVGNTFIGAQLSFTYNQLIMDYDSDTNNIFQLLVKNLNDGVLILNRAGEVLYLNDYYINITGNNRRDLIGRKIELIDPLYNDSNQLYLFKEKLENFGTFQGESWIKSSDGEVKPVWLNIFTIYNNKNEIYRRVVLLKDLGEVTNNNNKFLSLIHRDPLTSLYNKFIFIERVSARLLLKPDEHHWVILIDLDNFKPVNDQYGHTIGDKVLALFARRVKMVFLNHLTARYGGDEFLVYFGPNNSEKKINDLVKHLAIAMQKPIIVKGTEFYIKYSLGIARYPDNGKTVYKLLEYADDKMYVEKAEGRNNR